MIYLLVLSSHTIYFSLVMFKIFLHLWIILILAWDILPPAVPRAGFEKMCVLFNIGAMMSHIAGDLNLDSDEGMKTAAKYFQVDFLFALLM